MAAVGIELYPAAMLARFSTEAQRLEALDH